MSLIFPDAELWGTAYLREHLPSDVYVGREFPVESRSKVVTVRRQGGQGTRAERRLDAVRLGVNVWAPTDREAADLVALVIALFLRAGDLGMIKRVDSTGPSEITDDTGLVRRYFTTEYLTRGRPLHLNSGA